jgi:hypothetical protein
MDLNDKECEGTDWINLAEDREHWWGLLWTLKLDLWLNKLWRKQGLWTIWPIRRIWKRAVSVQLVILNLAAGFKYSTYTVYVHYSSYIEWDIMH